MVATENKAWLREHDANHQTLLAMRRRQEWLAFVARLELGWYASWRVVLTQAPVSPALSPLKPWLYNWGDMRR